MEKAVERIETDDVSLGNGVSIFGNHEERVGFRKGDDVTRAPGSHRMCDEFAVVIGSDLAREKRSSRAAVSELAAESRR